jgi:hypothetical protein
VTNTGALDNVVQGAFFVPSDKSAQFSPAPTGLIRTSQSYTTAPACPSLRFTTCQLGTVLTRFTPARTTNQFASTPLRLVRTDQFDPTIRF